MKKLIILLSMFSFSLNAHTASFQEAQSLNESIQISSRCNGDTTQLLIGLSLREAPLVVGEINQDKITKSILNELLNTETRVWLLKNYVQNTERLNEIASCQNLDLVSEETVSKGSICSNNVCSCWGDHCNLFAAVCNAVGGGLLEMSNNPLYGNHKTCILH